MPKKPFEIDCNCDGGYIYYGSGCSMRCDCQIQIHEPAKKAEKKDAMGYFLRTEIDGITKGLKIHSIKKEGKNTIAEFSYEYLDYSDNYVPTRETAKMKTSDFKMFRKAYVSGNLKLITDARFKASIRKAELDPAS